MSGIIERIARVLATLDGRQPDAMVPNPPDGEWPSAKDPRAPLWQVDYEDKARVIIEAMREPTREMGSAFMHENTGFPSLMERDGHFEWYGDFEDFKVSWDAAIGVETKK